MNPTPNCALENEDTNKNMLELNNITLLLTKSIPTLKHDPIERCI